MATSPNHLTTSVEDRLRFLAQVLEAVRDSVIFTDLDGRIQYWNRGAEEVFGYPAEEMVGQTPAVLYPSAGSATLAMDLERIMAGGVYVATWEGRRKDGSTVWVDVKTTRVEDSTGAPIGFLGVAKDATDRKRAEEALVQSERRYRQVSQASREALWEWDLERGKVEWSAGAETIFGYAPGAISPNGTLWPDQIHPEDRTRSLAGLNAAVAGTAASWSDEYRMRRKDGTYAVVADRAFIERDPGGRAVRVIGALADITQRKQAEEHYRQVDRLEAVGRLAGGIAHDLNNMLQSILGWAEMLARRFDADSPEATELGRIREPATRAANLTKQLLAFARKDFVRPRPVDVNTVVREAVALLRPLLGSEIEVDLRLAPNLYPVLADQSRLEQVVVNLGLNARDAMPKGGRLGFETSVATLDAGYVQRHGGVAIRPGRYMMLAVSDTGHGMDRATRDRIFEPFYTTKPIGKGTGLGLASVYGTVKQVGGLVWAYSEPGVGTVLKVYLPAYPSG
ncbi:MAG TPA: PAS domain S-box protein [Gemmatimonadales bacterium]|nr:PAS domain S-box protein [Gemmatimonadales bacterium]